MPGVEVAVVDKEVPTDQMGPQIMPSRVKIGDHDTKITPLTGAVGRTGDGVLVHTSAATGPVVLGKTVSYPVLHNHNLKHNHNDKANRSDRRVGSVLTKGNKLTRKMII